MSIFNKHLRVTFSLTPSESKRLIARGVAAMDKVRRSLDKAYTIIGPGTTNAFVAQEVFGLTDLPPRDLCNRHQFRRFTLHNRSRISGQITISGLQR